MPFTIKHGGGAGADYSQAADILWKSRLARAQQPPGFMGQLAQGISQGISRGVELGLEDRAKQRQTLQQQQMEMQLEALRQLGRMEIEGVQQSGYSERSRAEQALKVQIERQQQAAKYVNDNYGAWSKAAAEGRVLPANVTEMDQLNNDLETLRADPNTDGVDPGELFNAESRIYLKKQSLMQRSMPKTKTEFEEWRETNRTPDEFAREWLANDPNADPETVNKMARMGESGMWNKVYRNGQATWKWEKFDSKNEDKETTLLPGTQEYQAIQQQLKFPAGYVPKMKGGVLTGFVEIPKEEVPDQLVTLGMLAQLPDQQVSGIAKMWLANGIADPKTVVSLNPNTKTISPAPAGFEQPEQPDDERSREMRKSEQARKRAEAVVEQARRATERQQSDWAQAHPWEKDGFDYEAKFKENIKRAYDDPRRVDLMMLPEGESRAMYEQLLKADPGSLDNEDKDVLSFLKEMYGE